MRGARSPRLLLAAYPREWRERYGDELAVVLEAEHDRGRLSAGAALDVIAAGLVERLRGSGLVGDGRPPAERVRAGLLLVLCAWSAFVVAVVVLQKTAEHWQAATPPPQRPLPSGALDAVSAAAALGSAAIVLGVLLAAQSLRALVRSGGWSQLRRPILRASGLAALTGLVLAIVVVWAHHLTEAERNGGDRLYATAVLVLFAVAVGALAAWTHAGVVTARRLALGAETLAPRDLRGRNGHHLDGGDDGRGSNLVGVGRLGCARVSRRRAVAAARGDTHDDRRDHPRGRRDAPLAAVGAPAPRHVAAGGGSVCSRRGMAGRHPGRIPAMSTGGSATG